MADKKVSELTAITNLSGDDLLLVVNDPLGTPDSRKVTVSNFFANVAVSTVHTATSTFRANTTFNGTKVTMNANLMLGSTNALDGINDRMQVANVNAKFVGSTFTGNTGVERIVVANTISGLVLPVASNPPGTTNAALYIHPTGGDPTPAGSVWVAQNHLYVATDSKTIKKARIQYEVASVSLGFSAANNSAYTLSTVSGGTGVTGNETIYLYRGFTYEITNPLSHPIEIRNSANGAAFSNGVVTIGSRTQYFTVPMQQQSNLVYQCTNHAAMVGTIVIV